MRTWTDLRCPPMHRPRTQIGWTHEEHRRCGCQCYLTTPSTKASAERLVNIAEAVDEARRVEEVSVFQDLLAIE
ncbi:uncharacterized protein SPSK_06815 [Sporothrix schenckii 1099-18]|uniref:Uncharacterized protein n=1 Tax=Sporothrix schenckii 1099-18 TaxID=1397361 RepID=A0A0F2MIG5_SPOSC|nr:uncharacterized protein SPSK_06815 [Sporothrix schenckii 1099-18]KJR89478.1 hypothetical protein SPSK_06815 [Sporothrix schenckii 1099-18]